MGTQRIQKGEPRRKRSRKPLSEEGKPGRYDPRNGLNELTGKDWLLLAKSWWVSEACEADKPAYEHPAPFMIPDVEKLIGLFTKKGMLVLDPFVGSGSALIAAARLGRHGIGIDVNPLYKALAERRLGELSLRDYTYLVGNSSHLLVDVPFVDYCVTSPPYFNILRNKGNGIRHSTGKAYRIGARDGVEFYTEDPADLGNSDSYEGFLEGLESVMQGVFLRLRHRRYCTLIMSDFTVNKREVCVQADVVSLMQAIGFEFCGTTVLLQTVKPLFPFGYPYAYKINHHHQNMMTFRKSNRPLPYRKRRRSQPARLRRARPN